MKIKFMRGGDTTVDMDSKAKLDAAEKILLNIDPVKASLYRGDPAGTAVHWGNRYHAASDVIRLLLELALENGAFDVRHFKKNLEEQFPELQLQWNSDSLKSEYIPAVIAALVKKRALGLDFTPEELLALIDVSTQAAIDHAGITNGGRRIDTGAWGYGASEKPYHGHAADWEYIPEYLQYDPISVGDKNLRIAVVKGRGTDGRGLRYAMVDLHGNLYETNGKALQPSFWTRQVGEGSNSFVYDDDRMVYAMQWGKNGENLFKHFIDLNKDKLGIGTNTENLRQDVSKNGNYTSKGYQKGAMHRNGGTLKKILF